MSRISIHTNIPICRDWLRLEAEKTGLTEGQVIDIALKFYRNNITILEEYNHARAFLKEIIKKEVLDDCTKAKPLLKRFIEECKQEK